MTEAEQAEILAILNAVSSATPARLVHQGDDKTWGDIFCGDIDFEIHGWTVRVFNDCGDWDYIQSISAPDGRHWDYDDLTDEVKFWTPETDTGWSPGCVTTRGETA